MRTERTPQEIQTRPLDKDSSNGASGAMMSLPPFPSHNDSGRGRIDTTAAITKSEGRARRVYPSKAWPTLGIAP